MNQDISYDRRLILRLRPFLPFKEQARQPLSTTIHKLFPRAPLGRPLLVTHVFLATADQGVFCRIVFLDGQVHSASIVAPLSQISVHHPLKLSRPLIDFQKRSRARTSAEGACHSGLTINAPQPS